MLTIAVIQGPFGVCLHLWIAPAACETRFRCGKLTFPSAFSLAGGGNLAVLTSGSQEELHVKHQLPKHALGQHEHYGKVPLPLQVRTAMACCDLEIAATVSSAQCTALAGAA
jgi:hypothetical protein